jgi:hypothetical protein
MGMRGLRSLTRLLYAVAKPSKKTTPIYISKCVGSRFGLVALLPLFYNLHLATRSCLVLALLFKDTRSQLWLV